MEIETGEKVLTKLICFGELIDSNPFEKKLTFPSQKIRELFREYILGEIHYGYRDNVRSYLELHIYAEIIDEKKEESKDAAFRWLCDHARLLFNA